MVQYADLMKISEEETMLLTGESDYQKAAELLMQSGVKIVVVTLGKQVPTSRPDRADSW